jgi:hypothetical protein
VRSTTRRPREHRWAQPQGWALFPQGLSTRRRTEWTRDPSSPAPRLDDVHSPDAGVIDNSANLRPLTEADRRFVFGVVATTLVLTIFGQRFVLPAGGTPLALPLVTSYVAVFLLRVRGGIRYNRVRTELYIMAAAGVVVASWFSVLQGHGLSTNSLALLLVIYLPWVFCVSSQYSDLWPRIAKLFVRLMTGAAVVAVLQMALQLAGVWAYEDYLDTYVPPDFLAQGYNTSFPIAYESPIYKSNAFVFLEPSFICQYLSLGLIVGIIVRARAWQLLVLALGMASTLSGTGILLLVVGVVLIVIRAPRLIRPAYVLAGLLGLVIIFQTPAADMLLARSDEASRSGSSGSLRFVQPYTEVFDGLQENPVRYLVGAGPGQSDRLLESDAGGKIGEAVVYTIAPKLAFEYGLIAATVFMAFMLVSILRGPPMPVLPGAVIFMLFFLSGSLLQPHTVATAWLLTSIWGQPVTLGVSDALAARRRQRALDATPVPTPLATGATGDRSAPAPAPLSTP